MVSDERGYGLLRRLHARHVFEPRVEALSKLLAAQLRGRSTVLDIGCGSGEISRRIMDLDPGLRIRGIDVMARSGCAIECGEFDGRKISLSDRSVDVSMFVDVLHHTESAAPILREAARVSRGPVLIKDHLCESFFDQETLKFMDWVGNRPHGVALPYTYLSSRKWRELFDSLGLRETVWIERLRLYPGPANALFGRGLHFIAVVEKPAEAVRA